MAVPQRQEEQNAPDDLQKALVARVATLEGVTVADTFAEPHTHGFHLSKALP